MGGRGLLPISLAMCLAVRVAATLRDPTMVRALPLQPEPTQRSLECQLRFENLQSCQALPQRPESDVRACCTSIVAFHDAGCLW